VRTYAAKGALISADGLHRYMLWRVVNGYADLQWQRRVLWLMLNPSTADGMADDRTIGRCAEFTEAWGYTGFNVGNIYAYRATDPDHLADVAINGTDVIGPNNYKFLRHMADSSVLVVCGWGGNVPGCAEFHRKAVKTALAAIGRKPLLCLGTTQSGAPKHPLYIAGSTPLRPWTP
jgi:hypothetical protein